MTSDSKQQKKNRKGNRRGMSAASRANLDKGRNRHGAPRKGLSWRELIVEIGEEELPEGVTRKEATVRAAFYHAMKGNAAILKELMQRSEPAPHEVIIRHDWREVARAAGLDEREVLAEAERIIHESDIDAGDDESDEAEG